MPTFTETGQAQLVALVREVQPETLVVGDYETYGVFETLSPDINVVHVWPAVSVARADAAAATLRYAEGQHLLLVQASAPMVYNLPSARARWMHHRGDSMVSHDRSCVYCYARARGEKEGTIRCTASSRRR